MEEVHSDELKYLPLSDYIAFLQDLKFICNGQKDNLFKLIKKMMKVALTNKNQWVVT